MNVVWKRPDGFHNALPEDFVVVTVGSHTNIWLHKKDKERYPFRISGGWEEEAATCKLNNLVNLLSAKDSTAWVKHLTDSFHHSMIDDPEDYMNETFAWIADLKKFLKGDSWEIEIMGQALDLVVKNLNEIKPKFLEKANE
jgi:hypothetical protein